MKGHQIIQTSCRTGMTGVGSGFQVFSCDEELYLRGITAGTEYQKLFIFETPGDLGISAFGYIRLPDCGAVFNYNTPLAHDFGGEGTRSGNLLNQSILIDGPVLDFYPVEMFGSPFLRTEMSADEVNSPERPAFLPAVDAGPSGKVTVTGISSWIDDADRIEALKFLIVSLFDAIQDKKTIVILDTPENNVRWIAAVEYCLPLKLASQVSFISYSDNPVASRALIAGSEKGKFEKNTPGFMDSSYIILDTSDLDEVELVEEGPYLRFVDMALALNPEALVGFCRFLDSDVDVGFDILTFDGAYCLYRILHDSPEAWSPAGLKSALDTCVKNGSRAINAQTAELLFSSLSELDHMGVDTCMLILEYLIKERDLLPEEGKDSIKELVIESLLKLLCDNDMDSSEYSSYFGSLTGACSTAGLDIFEMLAEQQYRDVIFRADGLSVDKVRLLMLALSEYISSNGVAMTDLRHDAPYGILITDCIRVLLSSGVSCLAPAKEILRALADDFPALCTATITLEHAIEGAYETAGAGESKEALDTIDSLWFASIGLASDNRGVNASKVIEWVLFAVKVTGVYGERHFSYLVPYFDRLLARSGSLEAATALFSLFCSPDNLSNRDFVAIAYPGIASSYCEWLHHSEELGVPEEQRALLMRTLKLDASCDFLPYLVEEVSRGFSLQKPGREELGIVRRSLDYQIYYHVDILRGRAALIAAIVVLRGNSGNVSAGEMADRIEGLKIQERCVQTGLSRLDERRYFEQLADALLGTCYADAELMDIVDSLHLGNECRDMLVRGLLDCAVKGYSKEGDRESIKFVCCYVCIRGSGPEATICAKKLSSLQKGDLVGDIGPAVENRVHELDKAGFRPVQSWPAILEDAIGKSGRGLFSLFKR